MSTVATIGSESDSDNTEVPPIPEVPHVYPVAEEDIRLAFGAVLLDDLKALGADKLKVAQSQNVFSVVLDAEEELSLAFCDDALSDSRPETSSSKGLTDDHTDFDLELLIHQRDQVLAAVASGYNTSSLLDSTNTLDVAVGALGDAIRKAAMNYRHRNHVLNLQGDDACQMLEAIQTVRLLSLMRSGPTDTLTVARSLLSDTSQSACWYPLPC
jgi:hypothetical protein